MWCAQKCTCKNSPLQTREFCKTSSLFKVLIKTSLVDALSKVKENIIFSIPNHSKIHLFSFTSQTQCEVERSGKSQNFTEQFLICVNIMCCQSNLTGYRSPQIRCQKNPISDFPELFL